MAIVVTAEVSGLNESNYHESIRRAKKIGLGSPKGRLYHFCYGDKQNLQVLEVFENKARFVAYGFKFGPVLNKLGVDVKKTHIHDVYNIIEG